MEKIEAFIAARFHFQFKTSRARSIYIEFMEVHLDPDIRARLSRIASERGSDVECLARQAIELFVDYDEWFLREVDKGLSATCRGETVEHEEIGRMIRSRYPA